MMAPLCKSSAAGPGMMGLTLLRKFSGPHTSEVNLEARNFFGICAKRAALIGLNRRHLWVRYPVLKIHPYHLLAMLAETGKKLYATSHTGELKSESVASKASLKA